MSESGARTPATAPLDPEPPQEYVEAARLAPDHWLYLPDPAWRGEGPPPDWAVVGQWRSDSDGTIVEWEDNPEYRPSPEAMGWPEPADEIDRAIQLATTGYGPAEDVTAALSGAEVAVLVTADGEPVRASAPDGTPAVPVYTSPRYLHAAGRLASQNLPVGTLLTRVPPGHALYLNSTAPVGMVLPTEGLADLLEEGAARNDGASHSSTGAVAVDGGGPPNAPEPGVRVASPGGVDRNST
ncbi:type VII secretion system-associated protein [Streptomyces ardesiacus]|uniref:type VII secretion system-associated protein n=1 Tax=Streptomyces ardesiacus TaxID=285564 RepID=UPI0036CA5B46